MTVQTTFPASASTVDQSEDLPERDVIFTANGSERAARAVHRMGVLVGMESMNKRPPPDVPVEFVDWPFSKVGEGDPYELFEQHRAAVEEHQPKYAVAPDIDGTFDRADVFEMAKDLKREAEVVIIVPKNVHPSEVPPPFRVGMPCQSRYGPAPWKWTAYQDVDSVHLLGGSPTIHQEVLKYYIPVESVDTTAPVRGAQFGSYWTRCGWREIDGNMGTFYPCLRISYSELRITMNPDRRLEPRIDPP